MSLRGPGAQGASVYFHTEAGDSLGAGELGPPWPMRCTNTCGGQCGTLSVALPQAASDRPPSLESLAGRCPLAGALGLERTSAVSSPPPHTRTPAHCEAKLLLIWKGM